SVCLCVFLSLYTARRAEVCECVCVCVCSVLFKQLGEQKCLCVCECLCVCVCVCLCVCVCVLFLQRFSSFSSQVMVPRSVLFLSFSLSYFFFHCSAVSSTFTHTLFLMCFA